MSGTENTNQQIADGTLGIEAPPGFGSNPISPPVATSESPSTELQPEPQAEQSRAALQARTSFVSSVHSYIRENIQFADQKAIFFFTGSTALLAFLYKSGTAKAWMKPILQWNVIDLSAFLAMVGLSLGAVVALLVVMPRLPGSRRGFIFWEAVAEYESARHYADDLSKVTPATLAQSVAEHCQELSKVCRRKYQ
jgi:hypothetical protein